MVALPYTKPRKLLNNNIKQHDTSRPRWLGCMPQQISASLHYHCDCNEIYKCKNQEYGENPLDIKGPAFPIQIFEYFYKRNNIELVLITTCVPRDNGQVERVNRT